MTVSGADGVVCFAGVDWWYHNRGHNECQIMRRVARRVPVLWVNSLGMRAPAPGRTQLVARRYARKLASTIKGLRRDPGGMWIYSPLFVPRYTRRAVALNGRLVSAQVRWLTRRLGITRPSVWVTVPTAAPAALHGPCRRLVFNRCDDFSTFPEVDPGLIRPLEDQLLRGADHVLYASRTLLARERDRVRAAHYLSHGVDFDHFAVDRRGTATRHVATIRKMPRPIIGFYGALDDYTIDLELMVKVARRFRSGTLLLIGPTAMDLTPLLAQPNVRYLGPVAYDELPACAAEFDVGLMPWRRNEWIAACNPIKLKEYLALGFPIVTTPFEELAPYEHLVSVGDTHAAFLPAIEVALANDNPEQRTLRRSAVANESWDHRADQVARWLDLPVDVRLEVHPPGRMPGWPAGAASQPPSAAGRTPAA
jgi:hypothetical protein